MLSASARARSKSTMGAAGGFVAVALATSVAAAGLNDTGFTTCADASGASVSCTAASAVQGQDARYGRDAAAGTSALTKVGGGANGFDFTKISNAGAVLPATAPLGTAAGEWGCTYDNTTGLMWEVKTTSGLRSSANYYSWFDSNPATNGGSVGVSNGSSCSAIGRCDTEKFTQDVNAASMCGHNDWRMPTYRELHGLLRLGTSPLIDTGYFPNTVDGYFWSSVPVANDLSSAWFVYLGGGNPYYYGGRGGGAQVRLVRSGR